MQASKIYTFIFCLLIISTSMVSAQDNSPIINTDLVKEFSTNDELFKEPYVDKDEWRNEPVRHRYIHGGFKGTDTRFSFYFPSVEKYQGHFFQYITPVPDNENLSQGASGEEDKIGFCVENGAYFIETNGGGTAGMGIPGSGVDPSIGAYRANEASAQFSRIVAKWVYGEISRPYGYAFGGSGGAYRTIGGIENTEGVWDGVVPYVVGSPMAIPNVFTVRMFAMRVLNDKFPQIVDALEPGGSGDMYAGLNKEESEALHEVTGMGFPPLSWFGYKTMGIHAFSILYQTIVMVDRSYFTDDFWNKPDYAGSNPNGSFAKARLQKTSRIKTLITFDEAIRMKLMEPVSEKERGTADLAWKNIGGKEGSMPVAFQLEDVLPDVNFLGGDLNIKSGNAAGKTLFVAMIKDDKIILGVNDPKVLLEIKPGDEVQVDNSNFLAAQTYHRHQVPSKEYYVWNQFRDASGNPLYPQRPMLLGPMFTKSASGVVPAGKFKGKMILLSSLWDREAFPWQADWYRSKVHDNLGDSTDNYFRLWYTDHALHGDLTIQEDPTRTVSYLGVLQQALVDLSAWVEKGITPPSTTSYTVEDGQVKIPASAEERKGIQPTVNLMVNGNKRADIKAGQSVKFNAIVEVPVNAGSLVEARWDFEGKGAYPVNGEFKTIDQSNRHFTVASTYTFKNPGTYFITLRIASQREGNTNTYYTRIQNLDRVRVVVSQ
jgi:hypothetical protein